MDVRNRKRVLGFVKADCRAAGGGIQCRQLRLLSIVIQIRDRLVFVLVDFDPERCFSVVGNTLNLNSRRLPVCDFFRLLLIFGKNADIPVTIGIHQTQRIIRDRHGKILAQLKRLDVAKFEPILIIHSIRKNNAAVFDNIDLIHVFCQCCSIFRVTDSRPEQCTVIRQCNDGAPVGQQVTAHDLSLDLDSLAIHP